MSSVPPTLVPDERHGNVAPLLHEIRHALRHLLEEGEELTIDLNTLPMAPEELKALEAFLGKGEVTAEIEAGGTNRVHETGYPGVWWVELDGGGGGPMRFIEIAPVPTVLKSDPEDIRDGLEALEERLA